MNILARHTKTILLTHDHVSIPQFGTFFTDTECTVSEQDELFLPQRKVLRFTPEIDDNDTLLQESIAEAFHLNEEQAREKLHSEVALAGQILASTGSLDFDTLGTFNLIGGRIVFETCKATLVVPHMYGLDTISMPLLPTLTTQSETTHDRHSDNAYTIRLNRSFVHYAACIAATVLIFLVFGTPIGNGVRTTAAKRDLSSMFVPHINRTDFEALNSPDYFYDELADTLCADNASDIPKDSIATTATADTLEQSSAASGQPIAKQKSFTLVLACSMPKAGAEDFVKRMRKMGYNDIEIIEGKVRRIVYGSFNSEEEAYNAKRKFKEENPKVFNSAWVMQI